MLFAVLSRILVDVRGRAGKADGKHVFVSVAIKVVNPGEEVVRIVPPILRNWFIDLVLLPKVRPLGPIRPANHIGLAVTVDVDCRRSFGEVDIAELLSLEGR